MVRLVDADQRRPQTIRHDVLHVLPREATESCPGQQGGDNLAAVISNRSQRHFIFGGGLVIAVCQPT